MSKGVKAVRSASVRVQQGQLSRVSVYRSKKLGWTALVAVVAIGLALVPAIIIAQGMGDGGGNETSTLTAANGFAVESIRTLNETAFASKRGSDFQTLVRGLVNRCVNVAAWSLAFCRSEPVVVGVVSSCVG